MKTKQSFLLGLILLISINSLKSQDLIIGATADIGLSKITYSTSAIQSIPFEAKFNLSGNLGIFIERKAIGSFYLGIEAKWVQIEGIEKAENVEIILDNGGKIGYVSFQDKLHSSYIGLPMYCRFNIGKVGIKAGVQPMIFLFANSDYEAFGVLFDEPYSEERTTKVEFNKIDFGPTIGIDYRLTSKLRLNASYYHGLTNITASDAPFIRKNRQASLGINYIFLE